MFHVKQRVRDKLERYKTLVHTYAPALDLMSSAGLAGLEGKIAETTLYAEALLRADFAADSLLDVGSGVGLPVIPLAVRLPRATFYAVERRKRRATFLRLAAAQLELSNLYVVEADVKEVQLSPLSFFTAQAVGSFLQVYRLTCHLHGDQVTFVSRRGSDWKNEVAPLEREFDTSVKTVYDDALASHGRLVALELPGGRGCRPLG